MEYTPVVKPPQSRSLKSGRVLLKPGEEVGEHVTEKREELLVILKGTATLVEESEMITLEAGQTRYISEGKKHDVKNNTAEDLEYIYAVSLFS